MKGLYEQGSERSTDTIIANSVKVFSCVKKHDGSDVLVPATDFERVLANEEKAAATARLAIDKAMTSCK